MGGENNYWTANDSVEGKRAPGKGPRSCRWPDKYLSTSWFFYCIHRLFRLKREQVQTPALAYFRSLLLLLIHCCRHITNMTQLGDITGSAETRFKLFVPLCLEGRFELFVLLLL